MKHLFTSWLTLGIIVGSWSSTEAAEEISMDGDVMVIERTFGEDHPTISPDGKTLAICGNEALRFINIASQRTVAQFPEAVDTARVAHWHPSGRGMATCGDKIVLWSLNGRRTADLVADDLTPGRKPAYFNCMTFSNDGKRMAIGFHDGSLLIVDSATRTKRIALTNGHTEYVRCLAWGKDRLNSGGGYGDGSICVWNDTDGKLLAKHNPFSRETRALAVHPTDGKLLAAGNDNDVLLLDPANGDVLRRYPIDRSDEVGNLHSGSIGFLDEGEFVFATQWKDIQLWYSNGQPLKKLDGHNDRIRHAEVSPDGKLFVSAGGDFVRLYSTANILKGASPSSPESTPKNVPTPPRPAEPPDPYGINSFANWNVIRGQWQHDGKKLVGAGDSRIEFKRPLPAELTLRFKLQVHGETNPRVRFEAFHFGYEGRNRIFFLHGPKATGKPLSFELDREYAIEVSINEGGTRAMLTIDGREIAVSHPRPNSERTLSIEAGGRQSQGSCAFYDFEIMIPASQGKQRD